MLTRTFWEWCNLTSQANDRKYVLESRREGCRCWAWLPVPVDLFNEQSRSKIVTTTVLVQVYLAVTMRLWVPIISHQIITPMPTCGAAMAVLDVSLWHDG